MKKLIIALMLFASLGRANNLIDTWDGTSYTGTKDNVLSVNGSCPLVAGVTCTSQAIQSGATNGDWLVMNNPLLAALANHYGTFQADIYFTTITQQPVFFYVDDNVNPSFAQIVTGGYPKFSIVANSYVAQSSVSITANSCHNFKVTWDATNIIMTLDGVDVATTASAGSNLGLLTHGILGNYLGVPIFGCNCYYDNISITSDAAFTPTPSQTFTVAPTFTTTPTPTVTSTVAVPTYTFTVSPTFSASPSPTSSVTPTVTPTATRTITRTVTPTITRTVTKTITPTYTKTVTKTVTRTPSFTRSPTPTKTVTPTFSFSPTKTVTRTMTATRTPAMTATRTPIIFPPR